MKHGVDSVGLEAVKNGLAIVLRRQEHVIKVPVMLTVRRHNRAAEQAALLKWRQPFVVALPDRHALAGNAFRFLELRPQKGGGDLVRQK